VSARLPIGMDATAPVDAGVNTVVATPKLGRAYRVRSLAAKIALIPTILVMLGCYYASVTWTVYISMTRSLPVAMALSCTVIGMLSRPAKINPSR
jgi:hypothetical protein